MDGWNASRRASAMPAKDASLAHEKASRIDDHWPTRPGHAKNKGESLPTKPPDALKHESAILLAHSFLIPRRRTQHLLPLAADLWKQRSPTPWGKIIDIASFFIPEGHTVHAFLMHFDTIIISIAGIACTHLNMPNNVKLFSQNVTVAGWRNSTKNCIAFSHEINTYCKFCYSANCARGKSQRSCCMQESFFDSGRPTSFRTIFGIFLFGYIGAFASGTNLVVHHEQPPLVAPQI